MDLKEMLDASGQKAVVADKERKHRSVKGSHLTDTFVQLATEAGCDIRSDSSFHVIVGKAGKAARVSVAKRGGQVYLVGFEAPGCKVITREAAKARHIGRAMGEIDFEQDDDAVLAVYRAALDIINVPAPAEEPKKERKPRAKKEEVAAEQPASEPVEAIEEPGDPVVAELSEDEQVDADLAAAGDLDTSDMEPLEEGEEVIKL